MGWTGIIRICMEHRQTRSWEAWRVYFQSARTRRAYAQNARKFHPIQLSVTKILRTLKKGPLLDTPCCKRSHLTKSVRYLEMLPNTKQRIGLRESEGILNRAMFGTVPNGIPIQSFGRVFASPIKMKSPRCCSR